MFLVLLTLSADRVVLPIVNSQPSHPASRVSESTACREVDRGMDRSLDLYTVQAHGGELFSVEWAEGDYPVLTAQLDPDQVDA